MAQINGTSHPQVSTVRQPSAPRWRGYALGIAIAALLLLILQGGLKIGADTFQGITLVGPVPQAVGQYEKYDVAFGLGRSYGNPFDPEEIDVQGVFSTPSGQEVRVPAFIYDRAEGLWKLRFAPWELGAHRAKIVARDQTSQNELSLPTFEVVKSESKGFVRCTTEKPGRLQFDAGDMFLPVSIVVWGRFLSADAAELSQLRQGGINHIRLIMDETSSGGAYNIERLGLPLGEYDLERARNLDQLFDRLDALDMYVTLNFLLNIDFRTTDPWPRFSKNPYNAVNGGPCERPSDFFSHPDAKRLFKQRLRYTIARWGYSPRLCLLTLWAEADVSEDYDHHVEASRDWHREMADYLHAIDPYQHPVTTSLSHRSGSAPYERYGLFDIPNMDIATTELYNNRDMAEAVRQDALRTLHRYQKPHVVIECGLAYEMFSDDRDTEGIHYHGALWASAVSGSSMTPCFWHWSKVMSLGLLPHFAALSRYLEGEDFVGLQPIEAEGMRYATAPREETFGDLELLMPEEGIAWWPPTGETLQGREHAFTIEVPNDGRPLDVKAPRTLLPNRPIAFDLNYAANGEFVFAGWWLPETGTAKIRARLDDREVLSVDLRSVGWEGRFKDYQEYIGVPYSFPVPKGKHRIVLENVGDAWGTMSVDLCNYLQPDKPNLRAYGLGNETRAFLWITNRDNTWWRNRMGKTPRPVRNAALTISGLRPGRYEIEWWDTYGGGVTARREAVAGRDGALTLGVPEVARDLACKIRRQAEGN